MANDVLLWLLKYNQELERNYQNLTVFRFIIKGTTTIYNKGGKIINKHNSKLPGGNSLSKQDVTVLDCIYSESTRTYYLLDCLCWKNHPIVDSEVFSTLFLFELFRQNNLILIV